MANLNNGTDRIEIALRRILGVGVALGDDKHLVAARNGAFSGRNGPIAPHIDVDHHMRVDDKTAQRKHRQCSFLGHNISFSNYRYSGQKKGLPQKARPFLMQKCISWQPPPVQRPSLQW